MKYEVAGREYEVIDTISAENVNDGAPVPVIDMPMMSDERWQELAENQAVKHYIQRHGVIPANKKTALKVEREIVYGYLLAAGVKEKS